MKNATKPLLFTSSWSHAELLKSWPWASTASWAPPGQLQGVAPAAGQATGPQCGTQRCIVTWEAEIWRIEFKLNVAPLPSNKQLIKKLKLRSLRKMEKRREGEDEGSWRRKLRGRVERRVERRVGGRRKNIRKKKPSKSSNKAVKEGRWEEDEEDVNCKK